MKKFDLLLLWSNPNKRENRNFGAVIRLFVSYLFGFLPWIVVAEKISYVGEFANITTTTWNFLQCTNSKKNSCCDNYLWKYGTKREFYIPIICFKWHLILIFLNVEISSNKLKMYYVSKIVLTFYCLKNNILAFSLKFSKVFLDL